MDKDKEHAMMLQKLIPRKSIIIADYSIVSGVGVSGIMGDTTAKQAKPRFIAFVKTLDLSPEQETQVLCAGNTPHSGADDFLAGVKAERAMRQTLLEIRPDLNEALRNYYGGRNPCD